MREALSVAVLSWWCHGGLQGPHTHEAHALPLSYTLSPVAFILLVRLETLPPYASLQRTRCCPQHPRGSPSEFDSLIWPPAVLYTCVQTNTQSYKITFHTSCLKIDYDSCLGDRQRAGPLTDMLWETEGVFSQSCLLAAGFVCRPPTQKAGGRRSE